jgi:hypothetical protein
LLADSHIPHPSAERKFKFWKIDEVVLSDWALATRNDDDD